MTLRPGELTVKQAEKQILDILSRIPDDLLPKPDRTEKVTSRNGHPDEIYWFGGMGHHLRPITNSKPGSMFRLLDIFAEERLERDRRRAFGDRYTFRDDEQISGAS